MKFKHKVTGIIENVTNKSLIPQYLKYTETYEQVKEPKVDTSKKDTTTKEPKTKSK